jgi:protoporphyrin/coproporphyrin ferrochelatase
MPVPVTGRVGVLVMAHGTPRRTGDIASFYTRIRRGRPPSPEQLEELEMRYAAIGGLSPLTERTEAQVDAVRAELERRAPGHYVVAYGAKHTDPLIEEAAVTLAAAGVDEIIGLVLTPHGSSLGSEEYLTRAEAALAGSVPFHAVPPWYGEPDLVALLAERVDDALVQVGEGRDKEGRDKEGTDKEGTDKVGTDKVGRDIGSRDQSRYPVLFTAHSLPERVRDMGDTYPEQLQESASLVAAAAGLERWGVAWQSAGRTPEPWLGPDVRDAVRQLAAESRTGGEGAIEGVVVCPIGFVTDHLEVLYDLDVELAAVAREVGLPFARTASLNDNPRFIGVLADVICAEARRD